MGEETSFLRAFPAALAREVAAALSLLPARRHAPAEGFEVVVGGEPLVIPGRIYHPELRQQPPTELAAAILDCLYTWPGSSAATSRGSHRSCSRSSGNPRLLPRLRQRGISYWDCYHREKVRKREDYLSLRIVSTLEAWLIAAAAKG